LPIPSFRLPEKQNQVGRGLAPAGVCERLYPSYNYELSKGDKLMEAKKLHFIGIGGIGMSAIAKIMLGMGYNISGSDVKENHLTISLTEEGANIAYGHAANNIPVDCEAVVFSSAITMDNPEMVAASERRLPIYKRAEMLAFLMSMYCGIGVAGAHGKTTTSGMIATMLEYAGLDPTVVIGGTLPQIGSNAKAGSGRYLVAEADESDGTFLLLYPKVAVITNIEADHLDYYVNLDNIMKAFGQYIAQLPPDGLAVVNIDCPNIRELKELVPVRYTTYSITQKADYWAQDITHSPFGVHADIYNRDTYLGKLHMNVPGEHNIANALSAIACGAEFGLTFEKCAASLNRFTGTGRRFELLGEKSQVMVVDDYAHHPTEVAATIKAARDMGAQRVVAVFQPHRYTRTQAMAAEFAAVLMKADLVIVNEIYPAFEKPIKGVSANLIVEGAIAAGHVRTFFGETQDDVLDLLREKTRAGDMILVMGAGNIRTVGERFLCNA
jgi:UDP-N-acetylmuramate--alanine ligase